MAGVADFVSRLILDSKGFDNNLVASKGKINSFKKDMSTAGKSVSAFGSSLGINVGMLTKFGGAIGAAALAGEGLKKVINSNQVTGDAFTNTFNAAKTSLDNFAQAMGTMDFTGFYNGLDGVWRKAKELAEAIDQLVNTDFSFNVISGELQNQITQAKITLLDPNSTEEAKKEAQKFLDGVDKTLIKNAKTATQDALNVAKGIIAQNTQLETADISDDFVTNVMGIDLESNRDVIKKQVESGYNAYKKQVEAIKKKHTVVLNTVQDPMYGTVTQVTGIDDQAAMNAELRQATIQNETIIDQYRYLFAMSDEQQAQFVENIKKAQGYQAQALQMQLKALQTSNKVNKKSGGGSKKEEPVPAAEGSLKEAQEAVSKLQKLRDETTYGTQAWFEYNKQLEEAKKNLEMLEYGSSEEYLHPKKLQSNDNMLIKTTPTADIMAGAIKKKDEKLKEVGKELNSVPDTDVWSEFNNVLSNTSTIVTNMASAFSNASEVSASSILSMVATTVPAIGSMITALMALTMLEGTEKATSSSKHWIEAIAAVISVTATIGAAIASAVSMSQKYSGQFAKGGIVDGDSWTGDRMTASVNSGEMILTRAQQASLYKQINSPYGKAGDVQFHIAGTDLVGVLNNNTKRQSLVR